MADLVEQLNEARKVVEELGGKKTKSLDELKGELDRMIEASKKPGYSPNDAATLIKKRELVVSAMETALHVLVHDTLDTTAAESQKSAEAPTDPVIVPETGTSAFVSTSEKPETSKRTVPVTGTRLERFMSGARSMASSGYENVSKFLSWAGKGIRDFLAYAGTSISTLWSRLFGKKDNNAPAEEAVKPTEPTPEVPNDATRRYEENPSPSDQPTPSTPSDVTPSPSPEENNRTPKPEPTAPSTTPPTEAEATPSPEVAAVNMMDGKEHEISGHRFVWNGTAEHLLSFDGKKFGISAVSQLIVSRGLKSISIKDDGLVIETISGKMELNKEQLQSLLAQIAAGKTEVKSGLFGNKTIVPITVQYTSEISTGARTQKSTVIELLPQ